MAHVWWNCNYRDVALFNRTGYYYLPEVPRDKQTLQRLIDAIHTICFTVGGAIGSFTGQYWYSFLTRSILCELSFRDLIFFYPFRRAAIFVSMIFQLVASILMIITLEIYHGYTKGDPNLSIIRETIKNRDIAMTLLYISRFLSGWSAGSLNLKT